jgi:hypothetical protein
MCQVFVGAEVAPAACWVLVVVSSGCVLVVSDTGERLRTVRRDGAIFTCSCMDGIDSLLVGTARGSVLCFGVPSMEVWRKLPYNLCIRDSMHPTLLVFPQCLQIIVISAHFFINHQQCPVTNGLCDWQFPSQFKSCAAAITVARLGSRTSSARIETWLILVL